MVFLVRGEAKGAGGLEPSPQGCWMRHSPQGTAAGVNSTWLYTDPTLSLFPPLYTIGVLSLPCCQRRLDQASAGSALVVENPFISGWGPFCAGVGLLAGSHHESCLPQVPHTTHLRPSTLPTSFLPFCQLSSCPSKSSLCPPPTPSRLLWKVLPSPQHPIASLAEVWMLMLLN